MPGYWGRRRVTHPSRNPPEADVTAHAHSTSRECTAAKFAWLGRADPVFSERTRSTFRTHCTCKHCGTIAFQQSYRYFAILRSAVILWWPRFSMPTVPAGVSRRHLTDRGLKPSLRCGLCQADQPPVTQLVDDGLVCFSKV